MTVLRIILTEHVLELVLVAIGIFVVYKAKGKRTASPSARAYFDFSVANLVYLCVNVFMIMPRYGIFFTDRIAGFIIYTSYLAALATTAYFWLCYVETSMGSIWIKSVKNRRMAVIPVFLLTLLCILSYRTEWIFTIGPHGEYGFGSLWILQYVFCFGYCAAAMIHSAWNFLVLRNRTVNDRILMLTMCIGVAAVIMQLLFAYNYMSIALTVGLILSYNELYAVEIRNIEDFRQQMRFQDELHEKVKIAESFARTYNIAYIVNLADDTFELLRMDNGIIGYGVRFDRFSQAVDFFLSEAVYFVDRKKMARELDYDNIRNKLKDADSYSTEYRVISNGESIWHEMTVNALEGDMVVIGFAIRNREIIMRHLMEKETDNLFALFSVDLDTELLSVLKSSPWLDMMPVGTSAPYRKMVMSYANTIEGETKEMFMGIGDMESLKQRLMNEDKFTYSYQSFHIEGRKWVVAIVNVIMRHDDGTPSVITIGFQLMDTMSSDRQALANRLKENMEVIEGLAREYLALYYINFAENVFKVYSVDDRRLADTKKLLTEDNDPFVLFRKFILSQAVHPDDRHLFEGLTIESVKQRLAGCKKFSIRFRRDYGNGFLWSVMDVIKYNKPSQEANVVVVGFGECDKEIRQEHESERQLQEALSMVKSASVAKTNFLNSMSHDIRTPMNAITGFTGLALKHLDDIGQVKDCLDKISKSSDHLLSLINDVLDMSRIESGKMTLDEKPENLLEIMNTLENIVLSSATNKQLDLQTDCSEICNSVIVCDRLRLNQVLLNIVSNAIKYTPVGGSIRVEVKESGSDEPETGTYTFVIADTGMGMSSDFIGKIFDPFTRVKSTNMAGIQGTGLGMAITKNIIDMMGGHIDIQSEPGKGTTVVVTFNFHWQGVAAGQELEEPASMEPETDIAGCKVLLVEDNDMNREIAAAILEEYGCNVVEACNGETAVAKAASAEPDEFDAILMDIQMPGIDGYEATRQIRALDTCISRIPIIAMTANAFEEDRQEALKAGMNEHIAKPIDVAVLKSTLARFMK